MLKLTYFDYETRAILEEKFPNLRVDFDYGDFHDTWQFVINNDCSHLINMSKVNV